MPCRDGRDDSDTNEYRAVIYQRLDQATRVACKALRVLESLNQLPKNREVLDWWERHKEQDARKRLEQKEERERKRKRKKAMDLEKD